MKNNNLFKGRFLYPYALILLSLGLSACGTQSKFVYENEYEEDSLTPADSDTLNSYSGENIDSEELIYVYVGGHVKKCGLYELSTGSRVCDAINAAGGTDIDPDDLSLNPAAVLSDGERIIVMGKEKILDDESSGFSDVMTLSVMDSTGLHNSKININSAGFEALKTIPGIGEVRAKAIMDYRESKGFFKTVDDITKVSGIKEGTFEKIKDYITVD